MGSKQARLTRLTLRTQPDDRLVTLVREGHTAAYEEIVRRYRAPLVRFAATIVPRHQAEDAVQDALIRAHGALLDGDAEVALRAWLFTIVRNGAVSERRKIRPTEQLDETIDGVLRPPDIVERNERVRGVVARLKILPAPQREALVRTELGGESAEEIAAALGTTTGAVGQLVFRARAALRSGAALVLPMPVLRALLNAPPGGGAGASATGGLLASSVGSGGGGIAVKVGAAVVVAAIAVGPGQSPVGGEGERDRVVEIGGIGAPGEPADDPDADPGDAAGRSAAAPRRVGTAEATGPSAVRRAADGAGAGGAGGGSGGGSSATQSFDGTGTAGSAPADGPAGGALDHDGSHGAAPPPPPPPSGGGGGHQDAGGWDQAADSGDHQPHPDDHDTYAGHDGGGDGQYGGSDGGHDAYRAPGGDGSWDGGGGGFDGQHRDPP